MKADVVLFNPDTIRAEATFEDPKRLATGIEYVFVNGTLVWNQGQHTGALPGRALRKS